MRLVRARRAAGVLPLLFGACGAPDGPEVTVSGSSTVEPISISIAEVFAEVRPDVTVNIDGPGTGDGFELFCAGETDISDASRPIKEEEAVKCQRRGIEYVELKIAFDGLTVLTNPANTDVSCLNLADLYGLVGIEALGTETWDDAESIAHDLGSTTDLPPIDLSVVAPGEESGTYDSFVELALADPAELRVEAGEISAEESKVTRPDYQSSGDDNVIVQGIEGAEGGFGWVGYAFAREAGDGVKEVEIDGGDGCVAPSAATIADGSYPLSRSLYIYVNTARAVDNPAVSEYVDFYLAEAADEVEAVGYVPLPDEQLAETVAAWEGVR